jgi:hypothetical protein
VRNFVLQGGGKLIDISGRDVHGHAVLEKWGAVAADRVPPDLQQQSVNRVGIKFQRRETDDLAQTSCRPIAVRDKVSRWSWRRKCRPGR